MNGHDVNGYSQTMGQTVWDTLWTTLDGWPDLSTETLGVICTAAEQVTRAIVDQTAAEHTMDAGTVCWRPGQVEPAGSVRRNSPTRNRIPTFGTRSRICWRPPRKEVTHERQV